MLLRSEAIDYLRPNWLQNTLKATLERKLEQTKHVSVGVAAVVVLNNIEKLRDYIAMKNDAQLENCITTICTLIQQIIHWLISPNTINFLTKFNIQIEYFLKSIVHQGSSFYTQYR